MDEAIELRLTTQLTGQKETLIIRPDDPETSAEFADVWRLALRYSSADLTRGQPNLISRLALSNGATVDLPVQGQTFLIPESVPVFALYCPMEEFASRGCVAEDGVLLGTVEDLRNWRAFASDRIGASVDFLVALVSLVLGLSIEFRPQSKNTDAKDAPDAL